MTPAVRSLAAMAAVALVAACGGEPAVEPTRTPSATMTTPSPTPPPNPFTGLPQDELDRKLLDASTDDDVAAATQLVAAGASPDTLDDRHDTAWLITGVTGSVEMAKVLLTADPDLTIRNRFGGISIIPASERGHDDYVAYVLANTDIDVDHVNDLGWTALLEAVILGKGSEKWQRSVQSLVDHGADVSIPDKDGVTALQHARAKGYTQIARILTER